MSLTREQLLEGEFAFECFKNKDGETWNDRVGATWRAWLMLHGPELLRELRNLDMLRDMYQESVAAFQLEDKERREAQAKAAALTERVAGLEKALRGDAAKAQVVRLREALKDCTATLVAADASLYALGDTDPMLVPAVQAAARIGNEALAATSESAAAWLAEVQRKALERGKE